MVSDQTAGPTVAPATGLLGDEGDGGPWLLVALAASVAGSLGGTTYLRTARGRPAAPLLAAGLPGAGRAQRPRSPSTPDRARPSPAWVALITLPARDRSWMLMAAAALTAGSLARRLYRAGRRRRGS